MNTATLVMVTIIGFVPGHRFREVTAYPMPDLASCRAEVGGSLKATSSPLDRIRSYYFCVAASPRLLADDRFSMTKSIRPWHSMKLWMAREELDRCACAKFPGTFASLMRDERSRWNLIKRNML